jgi:UDP-glucose 4-epimerase
MEILVTGGTGLVGSRLLQHFVKAGIRCRALVRPGKELAADVTQITGDLFDAGSLKQAVEGVSVVIHLAAVFRTRDDGEIWKANLEGTQALIAAVKEHAPTARFIMASTSLVYDEDAARPGKEDDDLHPTLAYPASKVAAEIELKNSGLQWSILRLPFVYGDGDEHIAAVPRIVTMMKWHPARSFSLAHQRDVAVAFEMAARGVMDGRIVNIVDDAPTTLYEMAAAIGVPLEPSAEPLTHPWMGRADGALARSLGFRPSIATLYQAVELGIV